MRSPHLLISSRCALTADGPLQLFEPSLQFDVALFQPLDGNLQHTDQVTGVDRSCQTNLPYSARILMERWR